MGSRKAKNEMLVMVLDPSYTVYTRPSEMNGDESSCPL